MKNLSDTLIEKVEHRVIMLLLECIRQETEKNSDAYGFNANNAYYAEAFGIMRGLVITKHCTFGANNTPANRTNAKWWFDHCKDVAKTAVSMRGLAAAQKIYQDLVIKDDKNK